MALGIETISKNTEAGSGRKKIPYLREEMSIQSMYIEL
jgi:hypothetical protein